MVSFNTFRSRLLALATGAGLAAGLLGITGAQAEQYTVGEVDIFFDTTISAGASMRVADRETDFLPAGNGGPAESRPILSSDLCTTSVFAATGGSVCTPLGLSFIFNGPLGGPATASIRNTDFPDNHDGSINGDDGRLNWDNGDLIGAPLKVTHDLEARWRNLTAFVRASYFYDAVLDDGGNAARYPLGDDVTNDIGRGFDVLDAYLSADFNVGELPVTVRQGYQVINWGEATFFLNGISTINPIDVTAFRRPGSEIKEAFIPIHASFLQVGLPLDFSLEAFYQWEWEPFALDPAGSPFAGSDIIRPFDGTPGLGGSFIGGGPLAGTFRRNCDATALQASPFVYDGYLGGDPTDPGNYTAPGTAAGLNAAFAPVGGLGVLNQVILGVGGGLLAPSPVLSPGDCAGTAVDMRYNIPIGQNEEVRIANGDLNHIRRLADQDASDEGQFGVALRYYADWLNATEFGFYFTNTHSRLPFAQLVPMNDSRVFIDVTQAGDSSIGRQVIPTGCAVRGDLAGPGFLTTGSFGLYSIVGLEPALGGLAITSTNDPNGYMAAVAPVADAILAGAGTPGFTGGELQAEVAGGASLLTLMKINCALSAAQSGIVNITGGGFAAGAHGGLSDTAPMMATGAEILGYSTQHGVRFQYPEDIRMYGMSFNTTIGTWGVQGEIAYRDNQPLQLDTDSLTIASAALQCAFPAGVGDLGLAFEAQNVNGVSCNPFGPSSAIDGFVREEVFSGDIGTTATYTASTPLIGLLGADLGIFLTEAGFLYVPDAPKEGDFSVPQLQNTSCQGSDLPLGGLLGLDARPGCRADDFSWGYLLLGRLDYNNVFGAFTVSPLFVFSHDVEGTSPSPLTNYVEDTMSLSLRVGASYQNTWRADIGYTSFFGGGIENKNRDRDFASVSLSYSF